MNENSSNISQRAQTALKSHREIGKRNKFFAAKNLNPANFIFFKNFKFQERSKTSHSSKENYLVNLILERKKRNVKIRKRRLSVNENHPKISRYLIKKPKDASTQFRYTMSKEKLNILNS